MIEHITTTYTGSDATIEITIILLVAFILGFVFRSSMGRVSLNKLRREIHRLKRSESDLLRGKQNLSHKLDFVQNELKELRESSVAETESMLGEEEDFIKEMVRHSA